ncbi:MAG: hypothetical protein L3J69_14310 [Desulfobacula sp.]|nr:hypothetical protein [Desulfobacula sp.]
MKNSSIKGKGRILAKVVKKPIKESEKKDLIKIFDENFSSKKREEEKIIKLVD